jgi:hypothetical protein
MNVNGMDLDVDNGAGTELGNSNTTGCVRVEHESVGHEESEELDNDYQQNDSGSEIEMMEFISVMCPCVPLHEPHSDPFWGTTLLDANTRCAVVGCCDGCLKFDFTYTNQVAYAKCKISTKGKGFTKKLTFYPNLNGTPHLCALHSTV